MNHYYFLHKIISLLFIFLSLKNFVTTKVSTSIDNGILDLNHLISRRTVLVHLILYIFR